MTWCCVLTKYKSKSNVTLVRLYVLNALLCTVIIQAVNVKIGILLMDSITDIEESTITSTFADAKSYFSATDWSSLNAKLTVKHAKGIVEAETFMSTPEIDIFVAITDFKYVSTLNLFASELGKSLIISNSFLPVKYSPNSLSLFNGFKLTSLALAQYLEWFRWQNVALISADDSFWQQMVPSLENTLIKQRFIVKHSRTISNVSNSSAVLSVLEDISRAEKVIILAMDLADAVSFLHAASFWKLRHEHAYFLISQSPYFNVSELNLNVSTVQYENIAKSTFILSPSVPSTTNDETGQNAEVLTLEDAFICILHGLSLVLDNDVNNTTLTVDDVIDTVERSSFVVKNKTFTFHENYERYFDYVLYDFDATKTSFTISQIIVKDNSGNWKHRIINRFDAPLAPDDCFKTGSCTVEPGTNVALIVSLLMCALVVSAVVSFVAVFLWKRRVKLNMSKGPNKILLEQEDLTFLHKKEMKSSKIPNGNFLDKPDLVKASEKSTRSLASLHELSEFSEIARYKGDMVYVKEVISKGFEMKGKLFAYLRMLRDIRHENVNPLYGFLIDPLRPALVSEYCNRGSLQDVLKNENIKLDWDFKASLLTDLVRGIRYIQGSAIRYHGNLKSRNCVIDSRWVLKLTDYGMPGFRERAKMTVDYEASELLWTAPEHLRDQYPGAKGSEKGDIYGLAIIMQEVILRKDPFGMTELKPSEIIQKLKKPPPLLRPSVSPQAAQPMYIQLMKSCWAENPELRPAIEEIYQQFKSIAGGKKMNIVDSMFRMLEKYSNDLEDIVKERTVQLEEEKKKTDVLLFRMLPPSVAENLKLGRPINAETFKEVTIYFSDIVGFTTISAMSTPMQVVDLLNDLYTMFDATIDIYDVYKVETIGDAYMVSSGLPVPNGNRHAGEIGTMALDLLSQCGSFTIRHMPEVPLRLRIGLHSGSCVAGVVGLTMPRYCLFGDTVNTASRMESTGSAFRVHISHATKIVLDELEGYLTEYRGEVELKGKGMHKTYWLTGKDGFTKPLPEPPPLNDASNHGLESVIKQRKQSEVSSSGVQHSPDEDSGTGKTIETPDDPGVYANNTDSIESVNDNGTMKPSPDAPKSLSTCGISVISNNKDIASISCNDVGPLSPVAEV